MFTTRTGRPLTAKSAHARFMTLCRKLDLPRIRPHDLRHSFATAQLAAGADLKTTSELLGHSTIAITADTYAHVLDERRIQAAVNLDRLIHPDWT